jgi:hypothetical protein
MSLILVLGFAAITTAGGLCGSGDSKTSTPLSDGEFLFAAQAAANQSLLTLDDLPSGWGAERPDDLTFRAEYFSAGCAILAEDNWLPGVTDAETDDFTNRARTIASDATVYRNNSGADDAIAEFEAVWSRCNGELAPAIERSLTEAIAEQGGTLEQLEVSVEEFDPGDAGKMAFRVTMAFSVAGTPYTFITDNVLVREGKLIGGVTYQTDEAGHESQRDALVEIVADRMAEADSILPD